MYVCNCNGITVDGVEEAVRAGATKALDVYRHHDTKPVCGRCVKEITQLIRKGPRPYYQGSYLEQLKLSALAMREKHHELLADGWSWDGADGYYK